MIIIVKHAYSFLITPDHPKIPLTKRTAGVVILYSGRSLNRRHQCAIIGSLTSEKHSGGRSGVATHRIPNPPNAA